MRKKVLGFTLIELMIVIAIIAIIAAIAIPGLLRARISANEGSCSAGMRSMASAQTNYQKSGSTDQDLNGTGEYGVMNELTGATNRRGSEITAAGDQKPKLTTTDLSVSLQTNSAGYSSKSGYYMRIWLPNVSGAGNVVGDKDPTNQAALANIDATNLVNVPGISAQENKWIVYGWPSAYRSSGVRAFVCNEGAEVFASSNTTPGNTGYFYGDNAANRPVYDTCFDTSGAAVYDEQDWVNIRVKDNSPANIVDSNHTWLPAGS